MGLSFQTVLNWFSYREWKFAVEGENRWSQTFFCPQFDRRHHTTLRWKVCTWRWPAQPTGKPSSQHAWSQKQTSKVQTRASPASNANPKPSQNASAKSPSELMLQNGGWDEWCGLLLSVWQRSRTRRRMLGLMSRRVSRVRGLEFARGRRL